MGDPCEVRRLKLEKARAVFDQRRRRTQIYYWIFIPAFLTIIFYLREEIGVVFALPFMQLIDMVQNPWGDLIVTLLLIIFALTLIVALSKFSVKVSQVLERNNDHILEDYTMVIDDLIAEAEGKRSTKKKAARKKAIKSRKLGS